MVEMLKNNSIVWFILAMGTLIGIPSFIFTIYTWIKSKRKKVVSVEKASYSIVNKSNKPMEKLKVLFNGEEINNISVTQFAIWNSGNEEIRREDLASEGKLCIKSRGKAKILDAIITVESEHTNKFCIKSINDNCIELDFEYVDKKEGIILQIVHTGSFLDLLADVKIKGGQITQKKEIRKMYRLLNRLNIFIPPKVLFIIYSVLLPITVLALLIYELANYNQLIEYETYLHPNVDYSIIMNIVIVITCFLLLLTIVFFIAFIKKMYKTKVPAKLRDYVKVKE